MTGTIHKPMSMFLRVYVGTASAKGKVVYEFSNSVNNSAPLIESTKTGKWWSISWNELIELAQEAGIDQK